MIQVSAYQAGSLQVCNDDTGECLPGWVCAEALESISTSVSVFERKSTASWSISAGRRPATWLSRLNGTCPLTISVMRSLGSSFISRLNTTSLLSFCVADGTAAAAAGLPVVVVVSLVDVVLRVDDVDACVDLSLTCIRRQHQTVHIITYWHEKHCSERTHSRLLGLNVPTVQQLNTQMTVLRKLQLTTH